MMIKIRKFLFLMLGFMLCSSIIAKAECDLSVYEEESGIVKSITAVPIIRSLFDFDCKLNCEVSSESITACLLKEKDIKKEKDCSHCTPIKFDVSAGMKAMKNFSPASLIDKQEVLGEILVGAIELDDNACLAIGTSYGAVPLVCTKPHLKNLDTDREGYISKLCKVTFANATSRVPFNFSGTAVECLRESLDKVFFGDEDSKNLQLLKTVAEFQQLMSNAIRAALIIYAFFFGLQIVLSGERFMTLERMTTTALKIILVMYFSVGLGPASYKDGVKLQPNGMRELFLPFFSSATTEFAYIVYKAADMNGLCHFNSKDYPQGYGYYSLWDSLDCRIGYYLGLRFLYNRSPDGKKLPFNAIHTELPEDGGEGDELVVENNLSNVHDEHSLRDPSSFAFFVCLFAIFLAGQIVLFLVLLFFITFFIGMILNFITTFIACLVSLYAMCYISPIFIPMVLFDKTKAIFDRWLKLTISFALQPMIVAAFMSLLLSVVDTTMYKTCQFKRLDYQDPKNASRILSVFELMVPRNNALTNKHSYFQEVNGSGSEKSDNQICKESVGYRLIEFYHGKDWMRTTLLIFDIFVLNPEDSFLAGMFVILIFCGIFYFFSKKVNELAAQLTDGISVGNLAIQAGAGVDAARRIANQAIKAATDAAKGAATKGAGAAGEGASRAGIGGGAEDKISSGSNDQASDVTSTGNNDQASDKISSGNR